MLPEISIPLFNGNITIYTFWACLSIALIMTVWMIRKLCSKYGVEKSLFFESAYIFFIVTFLVSRLAHILLFYGIPGKSSFLVDYPSSFFSMSDFYFSFTGFILWIITSLWIIGKRYTIAQMRSIVDITVISLLFWAIIAYLWALLGGQIYGVEVNGVLSIDYSTSNPSLGDFRRFPLAAIYIMTAILSFTLAYLFKVAHPKDGYPTYVAIVAFSTLLLIGEFFNDASRDHFSSLFWLAQGWHFLNANQLLAIVWVIWGIRGMKHLMDSSTDDILPKKTANEKEIEKKLS